MERIVTTRWKSAHLREKKHTSRCHHRQMLCRLSNLIIALISNFRYELHVCICADAVLPQLFHIFDVCARFKVTVRSRRPGLANEALVKQLLNEGWSNI
eukprot:6206225-Amphidinium_carterae.1